MSVYTEHFIFGNVLSCDPDRDVSVAVIPVDSDFPVVDSSSEAHVGQHHSMLIAIASDCLVVIRYDNVRVWCRWVQSEPGN